ncbi:MAG: UDP-N-acetylmuramoylalanine--D-glutamate ligase [Fimbriimonadaceae bacterium]|nr:UDP-N-acetylmuramoylalanine--D-glutamate ligase [Fimbriimonadaceae bacterium]
MKGARIAVFGLARSGLSVAKAAIQLGASATVVDEKPEEALRGRGVLEEAQALGAQVELGWQGDFGSGFDFVVTSPGVPKHNPKLQHAVEQGVPVYSEVEFAYRIAKSPIVAITGTNGKSTTTVMTYNCLLAAGKKAVLCGNIYGSGYDEVPLTEAALTSGPEHVLVAEISSFQLEWVSTFKPIAAAITNITPDHLDRHATFEDYASAKQRIFSAQDANDYAVIPADDPAVKRPARPRVLTFGAAGQDARLEPDALVLKGKRIPLEALPFVGQHNYLNASAAALLASAGLTHGSERELCVPEEVIEGLRRFKGIAHRMELVGEKSGVKVINNSMCTNPVAVVTSSASISAPQHLLIGGSNKKLDFTPLRSYLESSQNRAYLFGRDAGALNEQLGGDYPVFATMADAFQAAVRNANAGEVIMLAPGCASIDQFEDFRDRGNVFKQIAKEWLES